MKEQLGSSERARRDFLEKAGKFALYTTPTIVMLMHPDTEAIASGGGGLNKKLRKKIKKKIIRRRRRRRWWSS